MRIIAHRYETPIGDFDYFESDSNLFTQEIAGTIRHMAIEQARALMHPPKDKVAQTRLKLRKYQRSLSIIDRLAYWYHTKLQSSS